MRLWTISGLVAGLALALAACGGGDPAVDEPATDVPVSGPTGTVEPVAMREAGPTLRSIRSRGRLNCGVHPGLVGFSYADNQGRWRGFDIDFCRATAAAVLGNPNAVRFVPLTNAERMGALTEGRVDVLWRNTSRTLTRDGAGIDFPGTNYFDGQGFLVRRNLNLASATELNGARVCVQSGSTSELNVADWFRAHGLDYTPVVVTSETAARAAYAREDCDAMTADVSALAAARTTLSDPRAHVILPEVISREALGPVVREGDDQWADIVGWTLNALILAEALNVTQDDVDRVAEDSRNPEVRRLLGLEGHIGRPLGLSDTWARHAIEAGGNYGEIFDRNLGASSALDLSRGLNALWTAEPRGLMYAAPIR
ncbi:amino acid ABC transporter substrate-binding protein [Brevundimonas aveniformis]|uniref:amino acid ABC transporter substrate-binding protein n=1 Tax=Brevundimonas aveniformis TaxID=370977 RepID=UPI00041000E4|nr:amino acid ABC transporter substrate-binding protein [Brevundimonas aveniformis]